MDLIEEAIAEAKDKSWDDYWKNTLVNSDCDDNGHYTEPTFSAGFYEGWKAACDFIIEKMRIK